MERRCTCRSPTATPSTTHDCMHHTVTQAKPAHLPEERCLGTRVQRRQHHIQRRGPAPRERRVWDRGRPLDAALPTITCLRGGESVLRR